MTDRYRDLDNYYEPYENCKKKRLNTYEHNCFIKKM